MVLIFAASGLGLLDYNLVWVNPTVPVARHRGWLDHGCGLHCGLGTSWWRW